MDQIVLTVFYTVSYDMIIVCTCKNGHDINVNKLLLSLPLGNARHSLFCLSYLYCPSSCERLVELVLVMLFGLGRTVNLLFIWESVEDKVFPMVAESLGGWSDEAIFIIQRVGRMLGQRLGVSPHIIIRQIFQKLAVTLWRGNATLLLRRRHPGPLALDFHS